MKEAERWLVLAYVHTLAGAVLVGKVVLLSFVMAPILAKNLEREPFGNVVRQLFPAVAGFIAVSGLIALYGSSAALLTAGGIRPWCYWLKATVAHR